MTATFCCKTPTTSEMELPSSKMSTHQRASIEKEKSRAVMEGMLMKYTNVMKGWQSRWFVLDPATGMLAYYEKEEQKSQKPRGCVHLAAALVSPCEDSGQSFVVSSIRGECFRLKAADTKERDKWINKLRTVARQHSGKDFQYPAVVPRDILSVNFLTNASTGFSKKQEHRDRSPVFNTSPVRLASPFEQLEDYYDDAVGHSRQMIRKIESLPDAPKKKGALTPLDKDLLQLKSTSKATLHCLSHCISVLKSSPDVYYRSWEGRWKEMGGGGGGVGGGGGGLYQPAVSPSPSMERNHLLPTPLSPPPRGAPAAAAGASARTDGSKDKAAHKSGAAEKVTKGGGGVKVDEDEVEDASVFQDTSLEVVEDHKSVILHLLSQLKLGMDLTKITLPTFILERRSLLEMFADCMAHPDTFLRIPDEEDPEKRMLLVLEWYVTSFHAGRQAQVAKKPYNPIIGETFLCSWLVPWNTVGGGGGGGNKGGGSKSSSPPLHLIYRAEQVSHHPPVSAFYFECAEKKVCMNGYIWTKSRFLGMSVGVSLVGSVKLSLVGRGEDYIFGLPSAYARSILSVPWVELGDKLVLACPQTKLTANINFQTKPFYGGTPHKVLAELKNANGDFLCKVNGEWNTSLEFTYAESPSKVIDTQKLKIWRKRVRPVNKQGEFESRRLWQHVTNALKVGDIDTATEHKHCLEEHQREGENHRKKTRTTFPTKYFRQDGDTWVYNNLLGSSSDNK